MKKYLVIGTIIDASKMNQELFEAHKTYTQAWMDKGRIVLSSLFTDYTGVANIVFAESLEELTAFYADEPFAKAGMQRYEFKEIDIHFVGPNLK